MTSGQQVSLTLEARVPSVPLARAAISEFFDRTCRGQEVREAVRLAVSEAVANAVLHAYAGLPVGDVLITAERQSRALFLRVRDWGGGMQAGSANHGLGMGLPFMTHSASSISIRRPDGGGTEVEMSFLCAEG